MDDRRKQTLKVFFVAYSIFLAWYFFYVVPQQAAKTQPAPTQFFAQAAGLEAESENSALSRKERLDKLQAAIKALEKAQKQERKTELGAVAQMEQVRLFVRLANFEGQQANTSYYDRAEQLLKRIEPGLQGVMLAQTPAAKDADAAQAARARYSGDIGAQATLQLNSIRADRDQRQSHHWLYHLVDKSVALTGRQPGFSYWFALVLISLLLKLLLYPVTKKQYQAQRDMARLQPQLKKLQEEMKGQPAQKIQQATMALYKANNVSLTAGCLPAILQMAVLIPIYQAVRKYEFQFTYGTFAWIGSTLSEKYWWVADNLAQFDAPLWALYLISTVGSSLLMPKMPTADPQQAKQQKMMLYGMPVIFGVMMWMGKWSSAFMLYWFAMNVVSLYQSWKLRSILHAGETDDAGPAEGAPRQPPGPIKPMSGVATPKDPNAAKRVRQPTPFSPPPRSSRKGPRRKRTARG